MMGIFVECKLATVSMVRLYDFIKDAGLENIFPMDEYHVTLAYSPEGFDYEPASQLEGTEVHPTGWSVFGQDEDSKVLVLEVSSLRLHIRHETLQSQGYTSKFPDYRPHVTVGLAKDVDINSLPIPNFSLILREEQAEPLDPDYQYKPETKIEN